MAEASNDKEAAQRKTGEEDSDTTGFLESLLNRLQLGEGPCAEQREKPKQLLTSVDMDGLVKYMQSDKCKQIITMAGAGISTSAGIPDFRSPGSGLYDNLQKYNLRSPEDMFDIGFFKTTPEPFFELAKQLWPGSFNPTPCHHFLRLLQDKGLLLRHYTQNIDTLERVAGIEDGKLVEAHGTFHVSHCLDCHQEYTQQWIKDEIFADKIPQCTKSDCNGLVKPDIVFFGENLPQRFFQCAMTDFKDADLLIILGTSLVVQPFASLMNRVPDTTPRLYINREKCTGGSFMALFGMRGFEFDSEDNYRDIFLEGDCDEGCYRLAEKLGWEKDLDALCQENSKKTEDCKDATGPSNNVKVQSEL